MNGGDVVIKVRAAKRRPVKERWSAEAILKIKAFRRRPAVNKTQASRLRRMREEDSRGEQPSAEDSGVMLEWGHRRKKGAQSHRLPHHPRNDAGVGEDTRLYRV